MKNKLIFSLLLIPALALAAPCIDDQKDVKALKKSIIPIGGFAVTASGIVVEKKELSDGRFQYLMIVPNNAVLDFGGLGKKIIHTNTKDEFKAMVVGRDSVNNIALIKFTTSLDFSPVAISDPDKVPFGGRNVLVGGYPLDAMDYLNLNFTNSNITPFSVSDKKISGFGVFIWQNDQWELLTLGTDKRRFIDGSNYVPNWSIHQIIYKYNVE